MCGNEPTETCDKCEPIDKRCNMDCEKNTLGTKCVVKGKLSCETK